jgi:hypothetical protein
MYAGAGSTGDQTLGFDEGAMVPVHGESRASVFVGRVFWYRAR